MAADSPKAFLDFDECERKPTMNFGAMADGFGSNCLKLVNEKEPIYNPTLRETI